MLDNIFQSARHL